MKNLFVFFGSIVAAAIFILPVAAQDAISQDGLQPQGRNDRRPNLMRELDLSPDQVQQIRRINQERRPVMDAAVTRLREASRSLDEAIYSDTLNEDEVEVRMKEVQTAQAELARLRFTSEVAVRKLLTPEQLVRFRDLRRQFAEQRRQFRNGRRNVRRGLPLRRINRSAKPLSN